MSLREEFSSNLGRLCEREGSVSAVCRHANINRQQFSRYLSGHALPNRRTLDKICRYFQVDESELFGVRIESEHGTPIRFGQWRHEDARAALDMLQGEEVPSLPGGLYFAHFVDPSNARTVMRSVMVVKKEGARATFRRLTCMAEPRGSWWSYFSSDHRGVVLERRQWIYLVGLNALGDREPTLIALRYVPSAAPLLAGHAALLTPLGPGVTAAVLSRCPSKMSLRKAVRSSHAYSMDDPALDTLVVEALERQCQDMVSNVAKLDLTVMPLVNR